jgi:diguanylate cyclase (GGDEF)-like protein/PAS domain S-box-containing protein
MDHSRVLRDPDDPDDEPFVPDLSEGGEASLYLALLELIDEGVIVASDELILEVNGAACRLLERSYRELVGQSLGTLFPDEQAFLNARARLFIQGEMRGSLQISLPGGRRRDLRFVGAARLRPGVHALVLSPDYLAEAIDPATVAVEADRLWPRLAAALEQPVIVLDGTRRVAAANSAALRALGRTRAELVGRDLADSLLVDLPEGDAGQGAVVARGPTGEQHVGRLLPGPKPGWQLLLLAPQARTGDGARSDGMDALMRLWQACPLPALVAQHDSGRLLYANPAAAGLHGLAAPHPADLAALGAPSGDAAIWHFHGGGGFDSEVLRYAVAPGIDVLLHDLPDQPLLSGHTRLPLQIVDASPQATLVCGPDNRILAVNRAFSTLTGYAPGDVLGRKPTMLASGRHDATFYTRMWRSLEEDGHWAGAIWNRRRDGAVRADWLAITAVRNATGAVLNYVASFADPDEKRLAEARSDYLRHYDGLTGLANLHLLQERFAQAADSARRRRGKLALIRLDLDAFRRVNVEHGHAHGDEALRQVAMRLRGALPEHALLARKRSDSFVALLTEVDLAREVEQVCAALVAAVAAPIAIGGRSLNLSASVGAAVWPDDGDEFEVLLRHARAAAECAQQAGGGQFRRYAAEPDPDLADGRRLEAELRQAAAGAQLEVYFVPEWRVEGLAAEALLRWRHPELGLVPTRRLLPLLRQGGLIVPYGNWLIEAACRQVAEWRRTNSGPAALVVDVTVEHLRDPAFADGAI